MDMTTIEIPTEVLNAANMTPDDVKVALASQLFKQGRITEVQSRLLAGNAARLEEIFLKKEAANQIDMSEFISWAAHDFKSPLNAIIGFTKVVLKGIDGPINEMQVTDLTSAHTNGQRMLWLTNNLIDMSRLSTGEIRIEMGEGDLTQTFADSANRWKTQNPAKSLQTSIALGESDFIFDGARMRQVISGLLTYAANHVAEGGTVSLRVRENGSFVEAEIESSGEKARDRYEMDLAMIGFICRGLIGLHGGELTLGDDSGSGLCLRFTLPKP
jgi:signal transduction histidine kinase